MRRASVLLLETAAQDIRHGWHALLSVPNFTTAALLALMLGIGPTTAIYSVVDRLLFRSLPYPEGERLVSFGVVAPLDSAEFVLSADWREWRAAAAASFESVTTFTPAEGVCDLAGDEPIRVSCVPVEATFLKTFGIRPVIGRDFTSQEDRPNGPRAAMISYGLWQSRFGGTAAVIGRSITVDGAAVSIAGVLGGDFEMPNLARVDLLLSQQLPFVAHPNSGRPLRAFGRLRPGVTVAQAEASLRTMFEGSLQWVPEAFRKEVTLRVRSLRDRQIQDVRFASWLLFGSVLGVMLIACANVSNLLLARAVMRRREIAVRSAIGASRARLVRQVMTENLLLGSIGGIFGCGLAALLIRLMIRLAPEGIPRLAQATLDARTLVFAATVSIVSAAVFGIVPALYAPPPEVLVHRGPVATRGLIRHLLISGQIAISLVLLTIAGLLIRTLWNLQTVSLGMHADSVIAAPILLPQRAYASPQQQRLFFEQLESRLQAAPGLGVVALSDSVPLGGPVSDITGRLGTRSQLFASIQIEGRAAFGQGTGGLVAWRRVSPDYFRVLGIPIVRGRGFQEDDRRSDQQVVIVSESLAQRLFPKDGAIGRRMRFGPVENPFKTIIGIAGDAKNNPNLSDLDDPEYYVPRKHDDSEGGSPNAAIILRTPMETASATNTIRSIVSTLDPALPVTAYTMQHRVSELTARPQFNAVLLGWFAATGILLAAVGLYGVVSFLTAQRTQEIGLRLALGATPGNIVRLVVLAAMRWSLLGIAAGLLGSYFATRVLNTLLFNVSARDPWTLTIVTVLMLIITSIAALLPSKRAGRTDPSVALRQQ